MGRQNKTKHRKAGFSHSLGSLVDFFSAVKHATLKLSRVMQEEGYGHLVWGNIRLSFCAFFV